MAVKSCCIENCHSCSTRNEDIGVTYHKFPKDTTTRDLWSDVTHHKLNLSGPTYVCSRHFRKTDFQMYEDNKYVLKPDAVPSIFPWDKAEEYLTAKMETVEENSEKKNREEPVEILNSSKESEAENVDAIKKFIEDQEKDLAEENDLIQVKDLVGDKSVSQEKDRTPVTDSKSDENVSEKESTQQKDNRVQQNESECKDITPLEELATLPVKDKETPVNENKEIHEETMAVASSVIDMILTESEAKIQEKKKDLKPVAKESINVGVKGKNSMALSVGSKVEAKDFAELWHPAEIMEVDYDEMEVLVHYEHKMKKHDEWISVSSPRLRPVGSKPATPVPSPPTPAPTPVDAAATTPVVVKDEPKEDKPKLTFVVGERCLTRWRDNRRFLATIIAQMDNDKYEIMFDDGVRWSCTTNRLSKLKETKKELSVDTNLPSTSSVPSPIYGPGPGEALATGTIPAFHTHLFDPTRDYLSSKSERREMKRKLNVKELFNIGQKKKKLDTSRSSRRSSSKKSSNVASSTPKVKSVKTPSSSKTAKVVKSSEKNLEAVQKQLRMEPVVELKKEFVEFKKELPDAVASIIGTVTTTEDTIPKTEVKDEVKDEIKEEVMDNSQTEFDETFDTTNSETLSAPETMDLKNDDDTVTEEEKLEQFEKSDNAENEGMLDRIKEVICKLEDGLKTVDSETAAQAKQNDALTNSVKVEVPLIEPDKIPAVKEDKKKLAKIKKGKKLRLLQEKRVKKQVEMVKSELEEMKKQVEEMRKEMLQKTEELAKKDKERSTEMPESFLLPGEWCCKWVNGQPVGKVSEIEYDGKVDSSRNALPRRSVQVEDKRLPPGWTKHMVRRSLGSSAGKWDVVLVNPENRRFHTKTDMRIYLENNPNPELRPYEYCLMDFGVHLKLSRRMGWYSVTPGGEQEIPITTPVGTLSTTSPLIKRKKLSIKNFIKDKDRKKKKKLSVRLKAPKSYYRHSAVELNDAGTSEVTVVDPNAPLDQPGEAVPLEDGYVYVGSLKVQIIENLLRCPAEGCFKNFRNNTLLKMHIKHYHRDLRKMLGATPQVLDLAFARQRPTAMDISRMRHEAVHKTIRVKLPRLPKRYTDPKRFADQKRLSEKKIAEPKRIEPKPERKETDVDVEGLVPKTEPLEKIPRSQDSPKLRLALHKAGGPVKRPKVLLPVRKPDPETSEIKEEQEVKLEPKTEDVMPLDFETAISTHTVTKPFLEKKKGEKKRKTFATISKKTMSEDEEWFVNNSDVETRSSFPRSSTPDSKTMDQKLVSSESNEEQKEANNYMYTETGERIKIVHMKREEIINCHCGFREEDGLMVQCELCLCWQHALCHNIQKESEVPEKYTCSICLNPRRGRRSARFLHDQDRLYEGLLPGAKPCDTLRRSHELSGNLLRIEDALHALRVKYYVATKKNHPKLYLWAKDWETAELAMTQERLNSDYSDLNIMINNIGKENLPVKEDVPLDIRTPPSEEHEERFSQKDNQLGSQALLSGLLSSPGGASLDFPISTSELERLAKTVQAEAEAVQRPPVPLPEAAIENSACRERLLRHVQRCQALIDARLDSIEAQVAELESQDPSFEDDETADYFPRTKQTIQMLMRDLDTMEELGVIT